MPTIARSSPVLTPPAIVVRPSRTHAVIISSTPTHTMIDDSQKPCPNRSQDRCASSSSGSRRRTAPAPKPPNMISAAPTNPRIV